MTNQDQRATILDRRTYLTAAYNRLVAKIGPFESTSLRDIVGLSILHVQLSQVIEVLAERSEEVQK